MNSSTALALPASLQTAVREAVAASTADNTERAYRSDAAVFVAFAEEQGLCPMPASPTTVAAFLAAEAEDGKAVATIRRRAASIAAWHRRQGAANPCADELVRATLRGLARQRGTDQRQAAGITHTDAAIIRSRMGDSLKDCRDLALMLVGRDLLARSSELVNLEVAAVEFEADGASVALRRMKTSTEAKPFWIGPEAAEALRAWMSRAGITAGAIFRSLTKSGRVTERVLDTRDVRRILKSRAMAARLKHGAKVSGHSLRVGMAQDLAGANTDLAGIMQAGSWKSVAMVARYTERVAVKRGAVARFYANRQGI
jgi:site-specific recombinase XerD